MITKIKLWFVNAGFTSVVYLAIALGIYLFGGALPIVGALKQELFGAFLGIFAYINWNVIRKIWNDDIKSKIDILTDKIDKL